MISGINYYFLYIIVVAVIMVRVIFIIKGVVVVVVVVVSAAVKLCFYCIGGFMSWDFCCLCSCGNECGRLLKYWKRKAKIRKRGI